MAVLLVAGLPADTRLESCRRSTISPVLSRTAAIVAARTPLSRHRAPVSRDLLPRVPRQGEAEGRPRPECLHDRRRGGEGPRRWEVVLEQLESGTMPPAKAKRQPKAEVRRGRHRLDPGDPQARGEAERRRSRPGPGAAAEQRRVRLHHPRPDGRRHPADAGVPRRPGQRGRVRQLGGIADDVAGPGEEVPGGGAAGRRPPRPEAATASPSRRTRWSPTPTATSTACGGSSTSTSGSGPTTPTTSWPPGGSGTAQALGRPEASLADVAAEAGLSRQVPGDDLVDPDGTGRRRSARSPRCRRCGASCPPPTARSADAARAGCERMRDFVVELRQQLTPEVKNLTARGISNGSQPLVLWKNRQYRREPEALRRRRAASSSPTS